MCVFGRNSKHIDGKLSNDLNRLFNSSTTAPIAGGLHLVTVQSSGTNLSLSPIPSSKGGTHEIFWDLFNREAQRVGSEVLSLNLPRQTAQQCSTKIDEILRVMAPKNQKSWLSQIRNEIQYKHEHRVWWFTKAAHRPDAEVLHSVMGRWRGDPMEIDLLSPCDDLRIFITSCTFLVSFCHALLEEVATHRTKYKPRAITLASR